MSENIPLSRKQEQFLQQLMLGKNITQASREIGIADKTAYRWLDNPVIQAERKRREAELSQLEQEEVQRILTSGYALMHKRVEALNKLSEKLEGYLEDEQKIWLADVKAVGLERVDLLTFNADLFKEYRATFDDLAKELGQRVKKQEIDARVENSGNVAVYLPQKHELLKESDADSDEESDDNNA